MTRAKPFSLIAAIIFALIALAHVYRLFTHFRVAIGRHSLPMWPSIVAIIVTIILAIGLLRESRSA